mgnify:CR=1 FL=1
MVEALDWAHGVFTGAAVASETTAAAVGQIGQVRRDPMAMLPFCGYNMGSYFKHWLTVGNATQADKLPKIFFVNWFRRDESGRFLWPGYGENSRVLKWVFERVSGTGAAVETPIGLLPTEGQIDTTGLDVSAADMQELLAVDRSGWQAAVPQIREHYAAFGPKLPNQLAAALDSLDKALANA